MPLSGVLTKSTIRHSFLSALSSDGQAVKISKGSKRCLSVIEDMFETLLRKTASGPSTNAQNMPVEIRGIMALVLWGQRRSCIRML